jgi:hypothetical protein
MGKHLYSNIILIVSSVYSFLPWVGSGDYKANISYNNRRNVNFTLIFEIADFSTPRPDLNHLVLSCSITLFYWLG